jgi:hypothetical protein
MDHAVPWEAIPQYHAAPKNASAPTLLLLCAVLSSWSHPARPAGTHLAVPPRLHEPQHCPLCCRKHEVHLALTDAAIGCTVLHKACAGHADTWLPVAERGAQQQQQPELMNQLQWQKQKQQRHVSSLQDQPHYAGKTASSAAWLPTTV